MTMNAKMSPSGQVTRDGYDFVVAFAGIQGTERPERRRPQLVGAKAVHVELADFPVAVVKYWN